MKAQLFQTIVQQAADGILVVDAYGIVLYANPASEVLLDRSADQLIGSSLGQPIVVEGSTEISILRGNGELVTVEMRTAEITWNEAPAVLASLRDISEHVRTSARIKHLNSVLRAIRGVDQLIITETDRERLLHRAVQMLVETLGYTSVMCVQFDDNEAPDIVAHSVATGESTQASKDIIRSYGLTPCMTQALEVNRLVVLESDARECIGCPFASFYPDNRRLVLGLVHDDTVYGVLVIALPEGISADEEDLDLFDEIAGDLSFALHGMRIDRLRTEIQERFRIITESSADAIFITDREGRYKYVNDAASRLLGYSVEELTKMSIADIATEKKIATDSFQRLLAEGSVYTDIELVRKDGKVIPVDLNSVILPNGMMYGSCRDVTERVRAQQRASLSLEVLSILNRSGEYLNRFRNIVSAVKRHMGIEAVGIRLRQGEDFPYYETNGFPEDFVKMENNLCQRDADGEIVRDTHGKPVLECMCGNILSGRTDPGLPFFTKGGSFWSNCTTELPATTAAGDLQARTRNRCNGEGYESMALIPLRSDEEIFGLLQLNDRRRDQFTPEMIRFLEGLGVSIGIALARDRAAEEITSISKFPSENPAPVLRVATDGDLLFINRAGASRLADWHLQVGRTVPPFLLDVIEHALEENAVETHYLACGEYTYSMCIAPSPEFGYVNLYASDITELRVNERNLMEEKEQAQRYLDIAAVMLLGLDADGRITLVNRRGLEILGVEHYQDLIGEDWFQFIPADVRAEVRELHQANIREGTGSQRVENLILKATGEKRRMVWHNAVVTDSSGTVVGTLSSGEDVTEQREMEAQLAQSDRLSSMGMLAAGVAHEINNPLSYVLYSLESLTEDLPELLSAIRQTQAQLGESSSTVDLHDILGSTAVQRMNPVLLDDILTRFKDALSGTYRIRDVARGLGTFSRVENDQLVPVNLMHVIEVAINMAFNEIKYRARLVKDFGTNVPLVMASEGRLSQVFLNLIINATHAIEEGDLENNRIYIRTWVEEEQVCAQVRDTGSGIAPENLGKLFDPFFTTKKIGAGSGLGLSISKGIIEGYDGTIEVKSKVGAGTCFTIRLPVRAPAAVEVITKADVGPAVRGRILIVDDEDGIRAIMVHMLREHDAVQASSGAQAKEMLESDQDFDLIICDMMMSNVSGMDLHEWLTEHHPRLAKQLIFITGGAFTPRARDYLKKVDNIRLEKPFEMTNFRKIVNELILAHRTESRPS
jgi:PAS domain S-box-containing protein